MPELIYVIGFISCMMIFGLTLFLIDRKRFYSIKDWGLIKNIEFEYHANQGGGADDQEGGNVYLLNGEKLHFYFNYYLRKIYTNAWDWTHKRAKNKC